jgi:hypothetical protein
MRQHGAASTVEADAAIAGVQHPWRIASMPAAHGVHAPASTAAMASEAIVRVHPRVKAGVLMASRAGGAGSTKWFPPRRESAGISCKPALAARDGNRCSKCSTGRATEIEEKRRHENRRSSRRRRPSARRVPDFRQRGWSKKNRGAFPRNDRGGSREIRS